MTSSQSTNGLSQKMEKMSVDGKRHADAPRYMPPHRKYAQATKAPETSRPASSKDSTKEPAATPSEASRVERLAEHEDMTTAGLKSTRETKTTPTATQEQQVEPEAKPKPTSRSMPPHKKYSNASNFSTTNSPAKEPEVADSWEEEATSDKDESSTQPSTKPTTTSTPNDRASSPAAQVPKSTYLPPHLKYRSAAPSPPSRSLTPPTSTPPTSRPSSSASTSTPSERRPEKTNAVAHRLIAGALGVKVPRRTEEQRAYDKAIREQEKKKRDAEREAKKKAEEDAVRAKAAIWED